MMGRNLIETVMGALVLIVAAVFVWLFYTTTQIRTIDGYDLTAIFAKIGGLQRGSDVRVAGINVGTVTGHRLSENFDAVVEMSIDPGVRLPDDTVAVITSDGLLGGKYVRLKPGRSQAMLAEGATISHTEDYRTLEDQVGEIIFLATNPGGGSR